jgi:uncharacterized protein YkwD
VSSQPNQNYFDTADTYTGVWNGHLYHGAMQFDLDSIPDGAFLNFARLEMTGRTREFLGTSGTWSVHLLEADADADFANHGYADIHNATVEATLLPLMGIADLDAGRGNTFNLSASQLAILRSRLATDRLSLRVDGPTSGAFSNLFTWDTGYTTESLYDGPVLVVNYSDTEPTPVPTATATDTPLPTDVPATATEGPSPTPTGTEIPPTATDTPPPPPPTGTATNTAVPPTETARPDSAVEIVPAQGDVGWVVQNRPGNYFGDDNTYAGYYQGLVYYGAAQFDLSPIPAGSAVLAARLTLTGQSTRFLSRQGNGLWNIRMLSPASDANWRAQSFATLSNAATDAILRPEMRQSDLDVGRANVFVFNELERRALEQRVATTRKVSLRFDGPSGGLSNVMDWCSGYGTGGCPAPTLYVVFGPPGSGEPTPTEPPVFRENALELIRAINAERLAAGVGPLTMDDALMRAAEVHTLDMSRNNFLSHTGSDGSTPAGRVAREGFQAAAVGEAVAGGGNGSVDQIIDAWLTQGQREQILEPGWTHVGAHYVRRTQTHYTHFWTAVFGQVGP